MITMKSKTFVLICFFISTAFLFLQCKPKHEKVILSQRQIPRTDDSVVFKQLRENAYYHKADSFYHADVNDSAVNYYNKALLEPTLKDEEFQQEILNRIGYTYIRMSNYKKSKFFLSKALLLVSQDNLDLVDANTFDYMGLLNHYTNESDSALFFLNKAYKVYFRIFGGKSLQIVKLNTQIGDVYRWIRFDYYNAEKYYYNALQIFESQGFDKKDDQYFRILYFLASTNRLKKDFNKALSYGLLSLQLANTIEPHKKYQEICYALVANIYLAMKDYNKSIEYYKRALEANSKVSKANNIYKPLYLNSLALTNYELGNYETSISYCNQAFEKFNKITPDLYEISLCYEYLGLSYQRLHQWSKAIKNLNHCLALRMKIFGARHPNTADSYHLLGKYYDATQNLDSAMHYYQLAIISGSREFKDLNIYSIPLLSQSTTNIELIEYLALKASVLKRKYRNTPTDNSYLFASLKCYELLDSLISFSRRSMDTEESKLSFTTSRNELYGDAIDCTFTLYQLKKDNLYIQKAFRFFEKNKYLLLLEKLKMAEAGSKAGVPDSLVESERNLNSELKFAQDKLAEEQSKKGANVIQIQALNARIFGLMRKIEKLHRIFEQQYPHYFEIKYHDINLTLDDLLQYSSRKNSDVIQYFWGEKFVYVISTAGNQLNFFRISNTPEFRDSLVSLITMMQEVNLTSGDKFKDYVSKANHFYNLLIKPAFVNNSVAEQELHRIIIIPDGLLSGLSFEALITKISNPLKFSYKKLPYMISQYDLAYAYSSTILLGNPGSSRRSRSNKLLGFGYSGDEKNAHKPVSYNGLPGTLEEMKAVSSRFRSRIFMGQNASEHNFKKWIQNYDIIHLALHGSADEEKESGSKLLFRTENDTVDDGMLLASEIYNLNIHAKLVVLSACETGLGKDFQGEGVFSMARAFAYAGCPSMVMSLWKVNDHSTALQMGSFYKYLSKGEPVNCALHQAKLEYLRNADEIAAQPVFWASFVALGDMSPVRSGNNYMFWLIGLLITGVVVFIVYKLVFKR